MKISKFVERYDKFIRVITIAPFIALLLLLALYFLAPQYSVTAQQLAYSILFLVILPVMGYPLQPIIPGFKNGGRKAQRNLAIITAVIGYICGIVYAFLGNVPDALLVIFLTYFISGVGIALFSKLTPIKASGHACGVMGPIAVAVYYISPWALVCLIIYGLAFISSVRMKRHTATEFLIGSLIPVAALAASVLICRAIRT